MTENDLIQKCKKGNREAFNILFSRYQSQVINTAYGMLSDTEDAYDAAQEEVSESFPDGKNIKINSRISRIPSPAKIAVYISSFI